MCSEPPTTNETIIFYTLTPALALRSDWDNHAFTLLGSGTAGRYFDNTSEDFNDFSLGANGRLDMALSGNAAASLTHARKHEARGSPDDEGGAEPNVFFQTTGVVGGSYGVDQISLRGKLTVDYFNHRDNDGANNDDRDRYEYEISGRASYEASEGTFVFVGPSYIWIDYDDFADDNGLQRNSEGYEVEVGLTLDYSGVSYLEAAIGFLRHTFDDPRLEAADGLFGRGKLVWNLTDLSTFTAELEHSVSETTSLDSSSTVSDELDLTYDHELLDNLLLGLEGGYQLIEVIGIVREDTILNGGISFKYLMNTNMTWQLDFSHTRQDSNDDIEDFKVNVAFLRLILKL